jgi:hypothetical protein
MFWAYYGAQHGSLLRVMNIYICGECVFCDAWSVWLVFAEFGFALFDAQYDDRLLGD